MGQFSMMLNSRDIIRHWYKVCVCCFVCVFFFFFFFFGGGGLRGVIRQMVYFRRETRIVQTLWGKIPFENKPLLPMLLSNSAA